MKHRRRLRQRHRRRLGAGDPARARLRRERAVLRGRRRLPEPPSRPEQAREPRRPDRRASRARRRRARPRLRRRRRPARRRHQGRQHHLPRPAADAVRRATCCSREPGAPILFDVKCSQRLAPLIRERRRRAADVEDRPLADQGEDEGDRRAARRRDERPHLLRRALVRLRRRHLHRGAAARDPEPSADPSAVLDALPNGFSTPGAERGLRRRRAGARWSSGCAPKRRFPGASEIVTIDGVRVDYDGRLRPDPRVEHHAGAGAALRGRDAEARWRASRRDCMAALRAVKPDAQIAGRGALTARRRGACAGGRRAHPDRQAVVARRRGACAAGRRRHPRGASRARRSTGWSSRASRRCCAAVGGIAEVIELPLRRWSRERLARRGGARARCAPSLARLRRERYDAVIDLQGLTKSALVARARARPELRPGQPHRRRRATSGRRAGWRRTRSASSRAATPSTARASSCARALGTPAAGPPAFGLAAAATPATPDRARVVFVHGTSRDDKLWPEAHWIELGRRLRRARAGAIALPHAERRGGGARRAHRRRASARPPRSGRRLDLGALHRPAGRDRAA